MSEKFKEIYDQSINNPEKFWQEASNDIFWFKKPTKILNKSNPPFYKWFEDGVTNTCYNALDIHIDQGRGKKTALIYDSPITGNKSQFSYEELRSKVSNANDAANIYLYLIHLNGLTGRNKKALAMSIIGKVKDQEKIFQYANNFLNKKEDSNHQFALDLFRILRDRGNLDAYLAIANMYEDGVVVKKDLKRAYNFVIAAARKGHIPSQKKVVDMSINGIGTQKSRSKSVYWLKKLIQSGDLEAKERLSSLEKG